MSSYPVDLEIAHQEKQSRLSALFRMILVVPQAVFGLFYGIAAHLVLLVAWFALLFTGKWPEGMYKYVTGYVRWSARMGSYCFLLTDKYPPFNGSADVDYPTTAVFAPPLDKYNRLKVFFRFILEIPLYIAIIALTIYLSILQLVAWVVEVVTGKLPEALYGQMTFCLSFIIRGGAYLLFVTETYPPFSDKEPGSAPAAPITPTPTSGKSA